MGVETEQVIVQNETNLPLIKAVVVMSQNLNGNQSRNIIPLFNNSEVSAGNPIPANLQAERIISNLDKKFRYAKFVFRFEGGAELVSGPYTTPGPNRFIQQIRLAVRRTDGKYIQVQIEDQKEFSLFADEKSEEFDDTADLT